MSKDGKVLGYRHFMGKFKQDEFAKLFPPLPEQGDVKSRYHNEAWIPVGAVGGRS